MYRVWMLEGVGKWKEKEQDKKRCGVTERLTFCVRLAGIWGSND